jgi:hypothetical protein
MQIPENYKPEINKLYDEIEALQSQSKKAFDERNVERFQQIDEKIKLNEARLEKIRKEYTREVCFV